MRKVAVIMITILLFLMLIPLPAKAYSVLPYYWAYRNPAVHYAFTNPQWQPAVINALNTWNYVANFRFSPNNNQQSNIIYDWPLGINNGGVLGITYLDWHPGYPFNPLYSATTVLNSSWPLVDVYQDPYGFDVQSLALHEFGHWLALDDLYSNSAAVMEHDLAPGISRRVLTLDDRNGIRAIYPNWYVNLSNGSSFGGTASSFTRWYGTQLGDKGLTGDFNGDGKTDILEVRPKTQSTALSSASSRSRTYMYAPSPRRSSALYLGLWAAFLS